MHHAGGCDHDVDLPELGDGFVDQSADCGNRTGVGLDCYCLVCADQFDGFFGGFGAVGVVDLGWVSTVRESEAFGWVL
jgi:hypothetical protein